MLINSSDRRTGVFSFLIFFFFSPFLLISLVNFFPFSFYSFVPCKHGWDIMWQSHGWRVKMTFYILQKKFKKIKIKKKMYNHNWIFRPGAAWTCTYSTIIFTAMCHKQFIWLYNKQVLLKKKKNMKKNYLDNLKMNTKINNGFDCSSK